MAGRIRDTDIALVRERSPIADVISARVTLRSAGGGSLKGLCPFHDEKTPSFNVNPSRGFFHCLAGETRVMTWDGIKPIRELAGGTHRILGARGDWIEAPFRSFGVQPLLRITLTRNRQRKEIYATDEHRWFVRSGRTLSSRREVLTKDLKPGARLAYVYPSSSLCDTQPSAFGIAHGITFGDGTRHGTGSSAYLVGDKDAQLRKWFPNSWVTQGYRPDIAVVHHLPRFFKSLPPIDESVSYLYGWLAGYFAADGCVAADGTVILNSARREHLEFVRLLCTRLGIATYGITEQMRVGIGATEETPLYRIHFVNDDLTEDFFLIDEHRDRFRLSAKAYSRRGWVVQSVEPTDRVEEVFCATVEDGHAFVLEDNILTGNCFGCAEGGDVISFVMKTEMLPFHDAVEWLASRAGIQLTYEEGGPAPVRQKPGQRQRLVAAHKAAAEFYAEQLRTADARVAREFLAQRGFDATAAGDYGCGFAPPGWDNLTKHLRKGGFSNDELIAAGLAKEARSGSLIDRFRRRLLWPIKDLTGDIIGFGARRLFDDDDGPKYLNTPETAIYKKSQVLYGLDVAKRDIAKDHRAVVVEGYTDVMACHLAGIKTAVATCGTAFGTEHIGVLRRLLMDQDEFRGEVIFTFDGDEAGQKAALKAFEEDQRFVAQTFIAVSPGGMDPCELRLAHGDAAVRDLIHRREPLIAFALRSVLRRYDLNTAEGRVAALRAAAPLVARIKDRALRPEYARKLAGDLGMEMEPVVRAVNDAGGGRSGPRAPRQATEQGRPDADDRALSSEREVLKLGVQQPVLAGPLFDAVDDSAYTHPVYRTVRRAIAAAGGAVAGTSGPEWVEKVMQGCDDLIARATVSELAVEPLRSAGDPDPRYVTMMLASVQELAVTRQIVELKSRVQRINPVEQADEHARLFGELVALEQHKRGLRERAIGGL